MLNLEAVLEGKFEMIRKGNTLNVLSTGLCCPKVATIVIKKNHIGDYQYILNGMTDLELLPIETKKFDLLLEIDGVTTCKFSLQKWAKKRINERIKEKVSLNVSNLSYLRKYKEEKREMLMEKLLEAKAEGIISSAFDLPKIFREALLHSNKKEKIAYLIKQGRLNDLLCVFSRREYDASGSWLEENKYINDYKKEYEKYSRAPKIIKELLTIEFQEEELAKVLDLKNLQHALKISPTKIEAMLLAVYLGDQIKNIKTIEEIETVLEVLVEAWYSRILFDSIKYEIKKAREILWKFRKSSKVFLKGILSVFEEIEVTETRVEIEKKIKEAAFRPEFSRYKEEYNLPELEDFSTTIPLVEVKTERLRAWVLDPKDPMQVALGADYLGGIKCCQCYGSAGEECVAEGLANPKSGFLGIQDEKGLVAQAWLWESVDGETLVLDNIELNKGRAVSYENIAEVLKMWCDALPYKGIQLGLGYTELKVGEKVVKKEFATAPFDIWDIYSDARYNRNWLKREGKVCI